MSNHPTPNGFPGRRNPDRQHLTGYERSSTPENKGLLPCFVILVWTVEKVGLASIDSLQAVKSDW